MRQVRCDASTGWTCEIENSPVRLVYVPRQTGCPRCEPAPVAVTHLALPAEAWPHYFTISVIPAP